MGLTSYCPEKQLYLPAVTENPEISGLSPGKFMLFEESPPGALSPPANSSLAIVTIRPEKIDGEGGGFDDGGRDIGDGDWGDRGKNEGNDDSIWPLYFFLGGVAVTISSYFAGAQYYHATHRLQDRRTEALNNRINKLQAANSGVYSGGPINARPRPVNHQINGYAGKAEKVAITGQTALGNYIEAQTLKAQLPSSTPYFEYAASGAGSGAVAFMLVAAACIRIKRSLSRSRIKKS